MLNKDYFAMKDLAKLKIDGKTYYRVFHHLAGMITGVSVFELAKDAPHSEVSLTELPIEEVPETMREKIASNQFLVDATDYDKELIIEAFSLKMQVVKAIAEKELNVGMKRKLLEFIEVGGHYFGFVYEDGMPYTKFYHLTIDPVNQELYVNGVPPEMLPALFEATSHKVLKNVESLTVQVDNGVYARVSLIEPEIALVTIVTASKGDGADETKLEVSMGFTLTKGKGDRWLATVVKEDQRERVEKEMENSFEAIYQDLLLKVFKVKGMEALEGI